MNKSGKIAEIQKVRKECKLSQRQFAERFHINIFTLQMWEQNINRTPDSVLFMTKRILELEEQIKELENQLKGSVEKPAEEEGNVKEESVAEEVVADEQK